MPDIEVKQMAYWQPLAVDEDGTPLDHGERMIEVEPGHWQSPLLAATLEFLQDKLPLP